MIKPRRDADKAYLGKVRDLPCVVCGRTPSDAHHIIGQGEGGMGTKAGDYFTLPLCRLHHWELHQDRIGWEARHGSQWKHVAITLRYVK